MPINAILAVKDGNVTETVNGFLKSLLEKALVEAVLVPVEVPSQRNAVQTLVSGPAGLEHARPLAPVMPVNSAKIISSMTRVSPSSRPVAAVLRSCELRALTELVKLKQADVTNLLLIGIDCFGTYGVADYAAFRQGHDSPDAFLEKASSGEDSLLRPACRVCQLPAPLNADITIGLIGVPTDREILLQADTPAGESALGGLGLEKAGDSSGRDQAISALTAERRKLKDDFDRLAREEVGGLESLLSALSACVACHNCRVACPICYCRECLLDSPTFMEWEADKYLDWTGRRGALRLPGDSLLFHLVRMNHMAASCVACGLCEDACPNGISVFRLFGLTGGGVQRAFEYVPGRSLEDELPQTAFKEDEFKNFEK